MNLEEFKNNIDYFYSNITSYNSTHNSNAINVYLGDKYQPLDNIIFEPITSSLRLFSNTADVTLNILQDREDCIDSLKEDITELEKKISTLLKENLKLKTKISNREAKNA